MMPRLRLRYFVPLAVLALGACLPAAPALASPASGTWTATGNLNTARFDDTSTLLQNGEVLVAGGSDDNTELASAELYNPASGTWSFTGSMTTPRAGQTATLLANGQVLVAGAGGSTDTSAELYNPATGTWALTGSMHTGREGQTATLLDNGEVLIAGGLASTSSFSVLPSAELYNPATGTWAVTGSMHTGRESQAATLLDNGQVLVEGGYNASAAPVTSAELYNPATGTWTATGSMTTAREGQDATLLPGGDVLVTAGVQAASGPFAELYTPAAGRWSSAGGTVCAADAACRIGSSATLLSNGDVLVAGGLEGLNSNPGSTATAMLYDPATGAWTSTGSLNTAREDQTATLLDNGQVLAAGGVNFVKHKFTQLASTELYTP